MLEDITVVQSAISAFNNAALWAPAFLWWAILMLPLFVVAFWCADAIVTRLGWTKDMVLERATMWTAGLTLLWVVLFGGNYSVLRDALSVLPMMVATIVFLTSLFCSSHLRTVPLSIRGWRLWALFGIATLIIGLSNMYSWWGAIVQVVAFVAGIVLGRFARADMRTIAGSVLIILTVAVAVLMQPEFFRFGQLGNLTVAHLIAMLVLGGLAAISVALFNVRPMGKLRNVVYIKLKWLMRVVCLLAMALFLLTEAVPVFLAAVCAIFLSVALSVWHMGALDVRMGYSVFACLLMQYGVIMTMPVVTVLGILLWHNYRVDGFGRKIRGLL